jgi:hypothetical protein
MQVSFYSWLSFSNILAIRQQFHGPRASTSGVCREEDTEQYKDVQEKSSIFKNHTLGLFACRYNYLKKIAAAFNYLSKEIGEINH